MIQHVPNSRHVAVLCKNRWYILNVFDTQGLRLTPRDLEKSGQAREMDLLVDTGPPSPFSDN